MQVLRNPTVRTITRVWYLVRMLLLRIMMIEGGAGSAGCNLALDGPALFVDGGVGGGLVEVDGDGFAVGEEEVPARGEERLAYAFSVWCGVGAVGYGDGEGEGDVKRGDILDGTAE